MRARMSVARGPHGGSIVSADLWRWANEEAKIQNINGRTPHKAIDSTFANWRRDSGLRIARWGRLESLPVTCVASTPGPNGLEHDPEKWNPVFRKRSCSNKKLERDADRTTTHPALGVWSASISVGEG